MINEKEFATLASQLMEIPGYTEEDLEDLKRCIEDSSLSGIPKKFLKERNELTTEEVKEEGELPPAEEEEEITDLRTLIGKMKVGKKIKMAMFGNSTCRSLLIYDPLKIIQLAVLKNPKLQEGEVEAFCKNKNTSQTVLREVFGDKKWFKGYATKLAICHNPKCPPDISTRILSFLHKSDVKDIARSKNLPSALVTIARKLVEKLDKH